MKNASLTRVARFGFAPMAVLVALGAFGWAAQAGPPEALAEESAESPAADSATDPATDPAADPATKAAAKILALRERITDSLTETKYQHRTVVRRDEGVYLWDCSGMVAWMLRRAAPAARKALDKGRPVARDFYRHIRRTPTKRARNGWRRIDHIDDVRPGDVFAWQRPPNFKSKSTGHVGFAVESPQPVARWPGAYTLRILDATSLLHDDDTRPEGGEGGWGEGTILFMTDGHGHGTAYGWFGERSRGVIETEIVFGRLTR
ncbi:MAG: hypothetical protein JKY37_00785 [Nannocystaceae bacterium]|nr:hypothetical protein [Nannocystaceae bacterium]